MQTMTRVKHRQFSVGELLRQWQEQIKSRPKNYVPELLGLAATSMLLPRDFNVTAAMVPFDHDRQGRLRSPITHVALFPTHGARVHDRKPTSELVYAGYRATVIDDGIDLAEAANVFAHDLRIEPKREMEFAGKCFNLGNEDLLASAMQLDAALQEADAAHRAVDKACGQNTTPKKHLEEVVAQRLVTLEEAVKVAREQLASTAMEPGAAAKLDSALEAMAAFKQVLTVERELIESQLLRPRYLVAFREAPSMSDSASLRAYVLHSLQRREKDDEGRNYYRDTPRLGMRSPGGMITAVLKAGDDGYDGQTVVQFDHDPSKLVKLPPKAPLATLVHEGIRTEYGTSLLRPFDVRYLQNWERFVATVGAETADWLLERAWKTAAESHDGLDCWPVDLVQHELHQAVKYYEDVRDLLAEDGRPAVQVVSGATASLGYRTSGVDCDFTRLNDNWSRKFQLLNV